MCTFFKLEMALLTILSYFRFFICSHILSVFQMTGRKGRVVSNDDGSISYESRSELDVPVEILNLTEKQRFMDGEKVREDGKREIGGENGTELPHVSDLGEGYKHIDLRNVGCVQGSWGAVCLFESQINRIS